MSSSVLSRLNIRDLTFLYNIFFVLLYVSVGILFIRGKHLHDRTISLRGKVWAHNSNLTPPFIFIEVPVLNQESERSSICVSGVSILHISTTLIFEFRIVPTLRYFFVFVFYFSFHKTLLFSFFNRQQIFDSLINSSYDKRVPPGIDYGGK